MIESALYYYRARTYDPKVGRFLQTDRVAPRWWDMNPYVYAGNGPVNFSDPFGLAPGDRFASPDDAARDAINYINPTSIWLNREFGGWIYQRNGQYTYDEPTQGEEHTIECFPQPPLHYSAWYHTHGDDSLDASGKTYDDENFSDEDMWTSNAFRVPGYLGTPSHQIKVYYPR